MRTYLSIDLDYWRFHKSEGPAIRFFKRVWLLDLKITVALHHHHLLPSINRCHPDKVINVDYHSDIADDHEDIELNEGTWANFVKNPKVFEWRYPDEQCLCCSEGYCHALDNPFELPECTNWQRVIKKQGVARIPWNQICAVGVCLSPGWIGYGLTVDYPMTCLRLYGWFERWRSVCTETKDYRAKDAEKGCGIFTPCLISPNVGCILK